ncbi:hypothetical protein KW822_08380 [Aeromonas sp. sia0103]|nr:hypothetical protein [Aeromonas sp. sia0103]
MSSTGQAAGRRVRLPSGRLRGLEGEHLVGGQGPVGPLDLDGHWLDVAEGALHHRAGQPGVAKGDLHVDVHGKLVTLKAEVRQHDSQSKDERTLRRPKQTVTPAPHRIPIE